LPAEIDTFDLCKKAVHECCRACSPSVTISIPASSCSFSINSVASRFASTSASPSSCHGAHSILGVASQAGFGRLPAIVVSSIDTPSAEAAAAAR
jgi:hypothetical protein